MMRDPPESRVDGGARFTTAGSRIGMNDDEASILRANEIYRVDLSTTRCATLSCACTGCAHRALETKG